MAAGIAAVGAGLGSAVANKLMGNSAVAPPGGGIPGLTSSKGSGKNGQKGSVVQVDPTIPLDYFKQAAATQAAGFNQGLTYYKDAVDKATQTIKSGYTDANNTLKPLSYASGQALNEQMRMLGLDPLPATSGFGDALRTSYGAIKAQVPGLQSDAVNALADKMDAAGQIQDPVERAKAKSYIQDQIGQLAKGIPASIQQQITDLGTRPTVYEPANGGGQNQYNISPEEWARIGGTPYAPAMQYDPKTNANTTPRPYTSFSLGGESDNGAALSANSKQQASTYDTTLSTLQQNLKDANSWVPDLNNFGADFSTNYAANYDAAYNGDQIAAKIQATPGYQFSIEQGTQAIQRNAAATGMLQSQNENLASQSFAQQTGMSYYNQYMGYLTGLINTGAPATAQISTNQINEGHDLSNLAMSYGAAAMDTSRQIATYGANTLMESGKLFNQDAIFNASLQFQGQQAQADRDEKAKEASDKQNAQNQQSAGAASGYLSGGGFF